MQDIVEKRLDIYEKTTRPIVDEYSKRGILVPFHLTSGVEDMVPPLMTLCDQQQWAEKLQVDQ